MLLTEEGHSLAEQRIVPDDIYQIRPAVSRWTADEHSKVVIRTAGTGITGRDTTPEAIAVLFDKQIDGSGK